MVDENVLVRATLSAGISTEAVYRLVTRMMDDEGIRGGVVLDVGCGAGQLWPYLTDRFQRYIGADVVRYESYPASLEFVPIDTVTGTLQIADRSGDVVVSAETIEHVENPRAFVREMVRVCKPGGWILITTPNQLSALSKLTLLWKNQFNSFQDGNYPAHLTALLESDLRRILTEASVPVRRVDYSCEGRIPGTARHWPEVATRLFPQLLSDNIGILGRRPENQPRVLGADFVERDYR
jgi:SAM-dependent methyltransferase